MGRGNARLRAIERSCEARWREPHQLLPNAGVEVLTYGCGRWDTGTTIASTGPAIRRRCRAAGRSISIELRHAPHSAVVPAHAPAIVPPLTPQRRPALRISAQARARGLHTLRDLKLAVLRQGPHWWQGHQYHCPLCDQNFGNAQCAAEHVVAEQHPVLRMD